MKKTILYRISSQGYPKIKIPGFNKIECLNNLIKTFKGWNFICVADNCDQEIINTLKSKYVFDRIIETNLGNPGSFWRLYEEALDVADENDIFYFAEDDYFHTVESPLAIEEGLEYFDYVTLYDHPDKYNLFDGPKNPYTKKNKFSEKTEIVKGGNFIWRTTNSTTMTFALKGKTLKNDLKIWGITKSIKRDVDFEVFCKITNQLPLIKGNLTSYLQRLFAHLLGRKRYLGVCIPGCSLHLESAYIGKHEKARFLESKLHIPL